FAFDGQIGSVTTMPPTSFDRAFNFKGSDNCHSERTRKMPRIVSGLFGGTSNKNPRGVSHVKRKATEQSFPSLTRRRSRHCEAVPRYSGRAGNGPRGDRGYHRRPVRLVERHVL